MLAQRIVLVLAVVAGAFAFTGCPCGGGNLPVELTAFSGRFGYYLEGPYGFTGALTKEALTDPEWVLEGTFQFPSSGYTVLAPDVQIMESFPEQVRVTLRVLLPPPNAAVLTVITEGPVYVLIPASERATFDVAVQEYCW